MSLKDKAAVGIAVLFHFSGFIGMLGSAKPWFVSMTPLTLLLMFGLLIFAEQNKDRKYYQYLLLVFATGLLVEIIGVNTGLLFGEYAYGGVLGYKVLGVPLLMGVQWFATIICSAHVLKYVSKKLKQQLSPIVFSLLAALITTACDFVLEPIAIDFDYWTWEGGLIPIFNYVCWFLISFGLHLMGALFFKKEEVSIFGVVLYFLQLLFFVSLLFTLP
jgi:bisanhydrobacterioruberin hydratase